MNSLYLTASLIGFSAGTAISVLLLILTVRAVKPLGGSEANILFVTRCLFWNVGGFGYSVALTLGALEQGRPALVFLACQYTAAAAWPVTVLSLWSSLNPVRSVTTYLPHPSRLMHSSLWEFSLTFRCAPIGPVRWDWFALLSLLAGMAFGLPLYWWLNAKPRAAA